jgi:preprotein translocase subunit SecG
MPLMLKLLLAVQVISALAIIVLVLLQQGKGADMGSAFGSGSSGSLFGATGAANFLSRATKWAAVVFFASTAGLAYVSHKGTSGPAVDSGVMQNFPADRSVPQVPGAAPAAPATGGASVPGAASVPAAPAAPAKPDASVSSAPAPATTEKPAETPAK